MPLRALKSAGPLSLPVIDIAGLASGDGEGRAAVGRAIRAAALDKGFFYIVGHGIDEALIARVFAASRAFFDQPMAEKLAIDKAKSPANRGYEPLRGQVLEAGTPPDLKEGFYLGIDLPPDDPAVVAGKFNHGANQWPRGIPDFAPAMNAYFAAMLALSERLMAGLALSLDLPWGHFDAFCTEPLAILRLLHYPPQPPQPAPGEKGCGAHTDFGGLTVLLQDDKGGLQVLDRDRDAWVDADPLPGSFVVNLGDMIARWTNDRYRSTLHRVINSSGQERYSVPFFHSGNPDHLVRCIPTCLAPGETPRYAPVTVEAHMREMYRRTYG